MLEIINLKTPVNKIKKWLVKNYLYLHPLVLSFYPVLFFANYNKDKLQASAVDIFTMLALNVLFGIVVLILSLFLLKQISKAALAAFAAIFAFFSFGHLESLFDSSLPHFNINFSATAYFPVRNFINVDIGATKLLYIFTIFTFLALFYYLKKAKNIYVNFHKGLLLFSLALIAFNLFELATYKRPAATTGSNQAFGDLTGGNDGFPDIYYIIPDSYARADILDEIYGYDNSEFIKILENKGFFVAEKSTSNYAHTSLSLTSSLNLKHLDYLSAEVGEETQDASYPLSMLSDNAMGRYLKKRGYVFVNFSSDNGMTENIAIADLNMQQNSLLKVGPFDLKLNEFSLTYLKTTAVYPIFRFKLLEFQRNQVLYVFENLHQLDHIKSPKFVLAHIIIPHPPYIFAKDGSVPEKAGKNIEDTETVKKLFLEQLEFTNTKLRESINDILAKNKNTVIIIQADHGPSILLGESFERQLVPSANIEGVKERMAILNAFYFPDGDYSMLTDDVTIVNTFRIVLNKYFNEELEMLENRNYISGYDKPYKLWDVTEMVKK
jgi:hypothetical protein